MHLMKVNKMSILKKTGKLRYLNLNLMMLGTKFMIRCVRRAIMKAKVATPLMSFFRIAIKKILTKLPKLVRTAIKKILIKLWKLVKRLMTKI